MALGGAGVSNFAYTSQSTVTGVSADGGVSGEGVALSRISPLALVWENDAVVWETESVLWELVTFDTDAAAYISAVEAADGQALEDAIKVAINDFVVGCKADGIWNAIKASCIMAGARTLAGALVPLVGTAPTNNNFISGDYDRKTGLVGDGSTKWLDTNRAGDADPVANYHFTVWQNELQSSSFGVLIASRGSNATNSSQILDVSSNDEYSFFVRSSQDIVKSPRFANRLVGVSLSNTDLSIKYADALDVSTYVATAQVSANWEIFSRSSKTNFTDSRLSFYSIGEALDLAQLDTRVSALMTDLGNAIP